jgi:16S rRNA (adenine1518-N6/adenine1519-N6)-dimethyltransferase
VNQGAGGRREPPGATFPDARAVLRAYGLRPDKRLGQHFLTDPAVLGEILAAAELRPSDEVLEIGPGPGILTAALLERSSRVVAVELDPQLRAVLLQFLGLDSRLEVVAADVLELDLAERMGFPPAAVGRRSGYKVVANLPYQITSAALRQVLEARVQPELAVLMIQREVAERILAAPGGLSVLGVSVQLYARPSLVTRVPAAAFYPAPKVESTVVRLDVYDKLPVDVPNRGLFFRVVRAGFGQRRKQLKNSLAAGLGLEPAAAAALLDAAGVDGSRRAQDLGLEEWAELARQAPAFLGLTPLRQ